MPLAAGFDDVFNIDHASLFLLFAFVHGTKHDRIDLAVGVLGVFWINVSTDPINETVKLGLDICVYFERVEAMSIRTCATSLDP